MAAYDSNTGEWVEGDIGRRRRGVVGLLSLHAAGPRQDLAAEEMDDEMLRGGAVAEEDDGGWMPDGEEVEDPFGHGGSLDQGIGPAHGEAEAPPNRNAIYVVNEGHSNALLGTQEHVARVPRESTLGPDSTPRCQERKEPVGSNLRRKVRGDGPTAKRKKENRERFAAWKSATADTLTRPAVQRNLAQVLGALRMRLLKKDHSWRDGEGRKSEDEVGGCRSDKAASSNEPGGTWKQARPGQAEKARARIKVAYATRHADTAEEEAAEEALGWLQVLGGAAAQSASTRVQRCGHGWLLSIMADNNHCHRLWQLPLDALAIGGEYPRKVGSVEALEEEPAAKRRSTEGEREEGRDEEVEVGACNLEGQAEGEQDGRSRRVRRKTGSVEENKGPRERRPVEEVLSAAVHQHLDKEQRSADDREEEDEVDRKRRTATITREAERKRLRDASAESTEEDTRSNRSKVKVRRRSLVIANEKEEKQCPGGFAPTIRPRVGECVVEDASWGGHRRGRLRHKQKCPLAA